MNKRLKYLVVLLIILVTIGVSYFYLAKYYFNQKIVSEYDKIYTAQDFPDRDQAMDSKILQVSLDDLNKQYRELKKGDHIYIRWVNIGILKKRFRDFSGAETAWQNAVSINPDLALAYGNLADLYLYFLKNDQKAEENYKKALSLDSSNYTYYFGLCALYRYNQTDKRNLIEGIMLDGVQKNLGTEVDYYLYLASYFSMEGADKAKTKLYSDKVMAIDPSLKNQLP